MISITLDSTHCDLGDALLCPSCGEANLHHEVTEVWNRRTEDARDGLHARLAGPVMTTDAIMSGNPSGRRNGLTVTFSCEHCTAHPVLTLLQHKGTTYIRWAEGSEISEPWDNGAPENVCLGSMNDVS